ncbi:MAG: cardiolipin synthase [Tissierellia bacterium]|nr:cardiolipin synthase [Tissierellia bacterium]
MISVNFFRQYILESTLFWIIHIMFTIYVIYKGRENPRSTLIWIMVVNTVPFVGFIAFLMFGKDTAKSKMFSLKKENDDIIEELSKIQYDQLSQKDYAYKDLRIEKYKQLIKMSLISDNAYFTEDNKIDLYYWGQDKFEAMFQDIRKAKKSIDIQYYIFRTDDIGKYFLKLLEEKIKEGVKVRFLYDALGCRRSRKKYFNRLKDLGAEVYPFFPSLLGLVNVRINYRNHRKIVIIDNKIGYLGGFNVGDEYVGKDKFFGAWRDTHMRISGGAVLGLKLRFLKDWYYTSGLEVDLDNDLDLTIVPGGNTASQVISSGPDTKSQNIKNAMLEMINSAEKEIYIQSPYLVPDQAVLEALKMALLKGVDLNIMIPAKADHTVVHWCSMSFAKELAKLGGKIYAYNKGFIHSKTLFVDDALATIGTTNLDERSFKLNFETNLIIYDEEINSKLKAQYLIDIEESTLMDEEVFKNRPLYTKIREPIARLFSPIF